MNFLTHSWNFGLAENLSLSLLAKWATKWYYLLASSLWKHFEHNFSGSKLSSGGKIWVNIYLRSAIFSCRNCFGVKCFWCWIVLANMFLDVKFCWGSSGFTFLGQKESWKGSERLRGNKPTFRNKLNLINYWLIIGRWRENRTGTNKTVMKDGWELGCK